jgi:hypothetical protein
VLTREAGVGERKDVLREGSRRRTGEPQIAAKAGHGVCDPGATWSHLRPRRDEVAPRLTRLRPTRLTRMHANIHHPSTSLGSTSLTAGRASSGHEEHEADTKHAKAGDDGSWTDGEIGRRGTAFAGEHSKTSFHNCSRVDKKPRRHDYRSDPIGMISSASGAVSDTPRRMRRQTRRQRVCGLALSVSPRVILWPYNGKEQPWSRKNDPCLRR